RGFVRGTLLNLRSSIVDGQSSIGDGRWMMDERRSTNSGGSGQDDCRADDRAPGRGRHEDPYKDTKPITAASASNFGRWHAVSPADTPSPGAQIRIRTPAAD